MKRQLLKIACGVFSLCAFIACGGGAEVIENTLRAPAYPLITIDPYTSGWSFTDNLYDGPVKHWTGKDFPLIGVVKVDGELYRFMGTEDPDMIPVVTTSLQGGWPSKYTTDKPAANWMKKEFNDSSWKSGKGAYGTPDLEPTAITDWYEEFIWVRRTVNLEESLAGRAVYLEYSHDDDAIIYVNGIEVVNSGNTCRKNVRLRLSDEVVKTLVAGENVIAGYCHNRGANALLDFGLIVERNDVRYFRNPAIQKSVNVQPTQTYYTFACGAVDLKLTFTAPLLMDDLDLMSRPVNYISYEIASNDGVEHDVELYLEASPRWALDQETQSATCEAFEKDGLVYLKTGSTTQDVLGKWGDDVRIDWGYFYLVADNNNTSYGIDECVNLRKTFVDGNELSTSKSNGGYDRLAMVRALGKVTDTKGKIMLGYDDIYSIQYFKENLRPYWNRDGKQTIDGQLRKAHNEYNSLMNKCARFDNDLMTRAAKAGGKEYAELCALAYRQAISAHKLVESPQGDILFLSKENFSNGSIGTVDVTYPSAPLFLLYNTDLVKGLLNHIFYYSESGKWTKPFAAHDVGTYPRANGQTYGGDMPVEESGNMLILTGAIAAVEGNAKYAEKHWDVLTVWTDYLVEKGLDPENQLCTDDFAGHFAHNTNLSVKAILGIASYGYLADMLGKKDVAAEYTGKAREMAAQWKEMAADGDHYRLTFDKPGTWSQKYNLVWDKLMKLDIFPKDIAPAEIAYYLTKQNVYGLPLDNRSTYTKTDWVIWTATLADDKATFEQFIAPLHKFMDETVDRIPMSDWIYTDKPTHTGFRARSVVGGYFIKMLEEKMK